MTAIAHQARLDAHLLAFGGQEVFHASEPHPDILLARGRPFPTTNRTRLKGPGHAGLRVLALAYSTHHVLDCAGTCELVRGYRLSKGGVWVPHVWAWDGSRVLDVQADAVAYFGAVLTADEAAAFVSGSIMPHLPGSGAGRRAA
jgi:hypothetical protein